jgi:hypothetical protein
MQSNNYVDFGIDYIHCQPNPHVDRGDEGRMPQHPRGVLVNHFSSGQKPLSLHDTGCWIRIS